MSTTQDLFWQAQLAEATYADFLKPNTSPEQALRAEGFSQSQAAAFVTHWSVVDQYDNSKLGGLIGTGFSATVFKSLSLIHI